MASIKRAKAEENLEIMKIIAAEHNNNQENPMVYQTLSVFGSYVNSDKEILGDLDIGVKIIRRNPDKMPPPEANHEQGVLLNENPQNKNMLEELFIGEHAMRKLLKIKGNL